jgi:ribosomal protein S12 methylthiotransferase accessory factor
VTDVRSSVQDLFDRVEYLVDDRVGIIREVREEPNDAGSPDFFCFFASACDTSAISRYKNAGIPGGSGVSTEREIAMAKAIGEAVERYCATIYDARDFPLVSFESAPFPCVPPGEFALYSQEQYAQENFPYVPFENNTPVRWAPAHDLTNGKTCHVPVPMIFLSYRYENGEQPIAQSVSTGLACHVNPNQAAVSAICEVIERDAFTITWQARLARPQIRLRTLSDSNSDLVKRFERAGSTVTLLHLAMDHGVCTVLAVLRSQSHESPPLVFAASTDLDPERAVRKSLEELAYGRIFSQWARNHLPRIVPGPRYENVVTLHDHGNLYCDPLNTPLTHFLFAPREIDFHELENLSTGDPKRDLHTVHARVKAVGHRLLLADVTSEDVGHLGLTVIRAVIPGFHPLFFGHTIRALGGTRLWEVPQKLGYAGITPAVGDNPAPHPFS